MLDYNPQIPLFAFHIPKTGGTSFEQVLKSWFNHPSFDIHPKILKLLSYGNIDYPLRRLLGSGLYCHYKDHITNTPPRTVPLGNKYGIFFNKKMPECVYGHFAPQSDQKNIFDFYPNAKQFITVLRDPLEMHTSLYFYQKKLLLSGGIYREGKKKEYNSFCEEFPNLETWIVNRNFFMLNSFPWQMSKDTFVNVINENFIHICVLDNYQKSVDILAQKLGFKTLNIPRKNTAIRDGQVPSVKAIRSFKDKYELEYLIYEYACKLNQNNFYQF